MRKEVLLAIILGVGLGVVVAFGIWRANQALTPRDTAQNQNVLPMPKPEDFSELVITEPENQAVVSQDSVIVRGAATPGATIAILASGNEYILEADKEGGFEQEVDLAPGPNEIKVISFASDGNTAEERLVVVYTTELSEDN